MVLERATDEEVPAENIDGHINADVRRGHEINVMYSTTMRSLLRPPSSSSLSLPWVTANK